MAAQRGGGRIFENPTLESRPTHFKSRPTPDRMHNQITCKYMSAIRHSSKALLLLLPEFLSEQEQSLCVSSGRNSKQDTTGVLNGGFRGGKGGANAPPLAEH